MVFVTARERSAIILLSLAALLGIGVNVYRLRHERVTIRIERTPSAGARWDGVLDAARHISLNTATAAEFERLPGVGPTLAARIIVYRTSHGPFTTVADLRAVPGVGPALFAHLNEYLTL